MMITSYTQSSHLACKFQYVQTQHKNSTNSLREETIAKAERRRQEITGYELVFGPAGWFQKAWSFEAAMENLWLPSSCLCTCERIEAE